MTLVDGVTEAAGGGGGMTAVTGEDAITAGGDGALDTVALAVATRASTEPHVSQNFEARGLEVPQSEHTIVAAAMAHSTLVIVPISVNSIGSRRWKCRSLFD